ncbi:DUF99 family protein [Candidatus Woesearchaeota archaeon]|nr:DUF99 family protein [Candidatus Woesearchaeota archaeon]
MKKELRILGIDDCPFNKFRDKKVKVIGAFFRGGNFIDGVMSAEADVDGTNSTARIAAMINRSRFRPQIQAVFIDGIAVGGFNIIDIESLHKNTKLPVIVVIRRLPDLKKIHLTLRKLGMEKKIALLEKAGEPVKMGKIYVQYKGINGEKVQELLKLTCTHSFIPEPIRVAHLIGQGITLGESRGSA